MTIREIACGESDAYDQLAREQGTIFHYPEWTSLFGIGLRRFGVFGKNGEIVAGFHVFSTGFSKCQFLHNPPCTPLCGPFFQIGARNPVAVLEARRDVITAMASFLDRKEHALVTLSLGRDIDDALPFVWNRFKVVPRYTYLIDLTLPSDERKRNMSPTRRNDLSKATRDGLTVRQVSDFAIVKALVRDGFIRNKLGSNDDWLGAIFDRFAQPENSYGFVTSRDEIPLAAVFVVYDRRTAYYILGGYRTEGGHHGAGALALAEAIEHAARLGLQVFDFEGSMIPAIEKYFRGFGGELTPFFTVNKAWLPVELGLKLVKRHLF
jgi:hypothetical protein